MIEEKNNSISKMKDVELANSNLNSGSVIPTISNLSRLNNDFQTFEKTVVVPYTDAANANYYPLFYIAEVPCFLLQATLRHEANSTSGTVDIEKLTSGTARGVGTSMLVGVFSIASGASTTQMRTPALAAVKSIQLAPGDSMALKAGGNLTNAQHVCVTVLMGINNRQIPISANVGNFLTGS